VTVRTYTILVWFDIPAVINMWL